MVWSRYELAFRQLLTLGGYMNSAPEIAWPYDNWWPLEQIQTMLLKLTLNQLLTLGVDMNYALDIDHLTIVDFC